MKHGTRKIKSIITGLLVFGVMSSIAVADGVDKTHWIESVAKVNDTYYDTNNHVIDISQETIYMDDNDNRYYYPYDGTKNHVCNHQIENVPSSIVREMVKDGVE